MKGDHVTLVRSPVLYDLDIGPVNSYSLLGV